MIQTLLAFSWAGTQYEWYSPQIIGLFAGSAVSLLVFILIERNVASPVLPLHLFRNSIFTLSNASGFMLGAGMFGAIMYMPWFIQGVMGTSATLSGYVTMPMTLSLVLGSAIGGQLMTRTGKYKLMALAGVVVMSAGMFSLSRMNPDTTTFSAIINMIVTGLGLGLAMPVYSLTVQNAVDPKLLGVATASSQLFRSLGGTIGVSVMSTIMAQRLADKMADAQGSGAAAGNTQLPADAAKQFEALRNPQTLLDPEKLTSIHDSLPPDLQTEFAHLVTMLREAMSYALSGVFLSGAFVLLAALLLTLFIKEIPLRTARSKSETIEVKTEPSKA
jgi:predicted MFS family arabinose efflux permease